MEFLTPKEKRKKTTQLFVGYGLMATLIGLAALVLIFVAEGYGYDPNKGVNQSGLVFFNSNPAGANIYLNGPLQSSQTNTKFNLLGGTYNASVQKTNYIDWNKTINVVGGTVTYYDYIRLFPKNIPTSSIGTLESAPAWVSQSPNGQWLVMQPSNLKADLSVLDITNPKNGPKTITLPQSIVLSESANFGTFSLVEWADDNNHLLLLQTLPSGKKEYLMIDKNNVSNSSNVSTAISLPETASLSLFNNKYNQYLVFDKTAGTLKLANSTAIQTSTLLSNIASFKSHGDNVILYVSTPSAEGISRVGVLSDQKDHYRLQDVVADPSGHYLLDLTQYSGRWYYVVSSTAQNKVFIYNNPLSNISPNNTQPITPQLALQIANPTFSSFSTSARYISIQSGSNFVVFDAELDHVYRYTVSLTIPSSLEAKWMDPSHLSVVTGGIEHVFEFDGSNLVNLTKSNPSYRAYFNPANSYIYTIIDQPNAKFSIQEGKLVL
jgi:hypothetical protein